VTEYEDEPVRGLPGYLPAGEQIVWQGEPQWRALSRRVFHTRKVALYFGILMLASAAQRITAGQSLPEIAGSVAWQFALGAVSVGILTLLAWLYARSTVYTITNKRVVMRLGIVLTVSFNLPLKQVASADVRVLQKGIGDITLALQGSDRIAWVHLWPSVRPWRISKPEPTLRAIPDVQVVADKLREAWTQSTGQAANASATSNEAQRDRRDNSSMQVRPV